MEAIVNKLEDSLSLGFGAYIDSEMISTLNEEPHLAQDILSDSQMNFTKSGLSQLQLGY